MGELSQALVQKGSSSHSEILMQKESVSHYKALVLFLELKLSWSLGLLLMRQEQDLLYEAVEGQ